MNSYPWNKPLRIELKHKQKKIMMFNLELELQEIAKAEEISWRQKSRCLWLGGGGIEIRRIFLKIANSQRRNNYIDKLKVGSEILEDKEKIKVKILDFYQKLYTEHEICRLTSVTVQLAPKRRKEHGQKALLREMRSWQLFNFVHQIKLQGQMTLQWPFQKASLGDY